MTPSGSTRSRATTRALAGIGDLATARLESFGEASRGDTA
ncbi:Hypothetical protein A7982_01058 [Minicystis rosea]|nr:Hypothetical protein A7982_01058 [Minicystis rosea]